jgi:dihydropteroate synthase
MVIGERGIIMGILNTTPDSFSDGGLYYKENEISISAALERVKMMLSEGADIIDIGGESTRPGSKTISVEDEISRTVPIIKAIRAELPNDIWISIDTNKKEVAEAAFTAGANMVNCLGGVSRNPKLLAFIKARDCPFVVYHSKGIPEFMQSGEIEYADLIGEIRAFFESEITACVKSCLHDPQILLDPGIGFGKTVEQNAEIIKRLNEFSDLNRPILLGVSRKSHLGVILKKQLCLTEIPGPLERIEASLAETAIGLHNGAHIIRTHDVGVTKKFIATLDYFYKTHHQVYLALGGNVGDVRTQIDDAIVLLSAKLSDIRRAPTYISKAMYHTEQEDFLNTVIAGKTDLSPESLLVFIKEIETTIGRKIRFSNGPREIDIDILFYDDLILASPRLVIPHEHINERAFVLVPLASLAPKLNHPVVKKTIEQLKDELSVEALSEIQLLV